MAKKNKGIDKNGTARLAGLFFVVFKLSIFTFGGGYTVISLMKREFCDRRDWIKEEEMLDFTALAQSSPGAIAVNAALLAGRHIAGTAGGIVAVTATLLPPLIIMTLISGIYNQINESLWVRHLLLGMQAAVAAVIFDAAITLATTVWRNGKLFAGVIIVFSFLLTAFTSINVVFIILAAAITGIIRAVAK